MHNHSFDILQRGLNITGMHFLEASAGTGKTFAIEHLVVRLVLEAFAIEEILVVTFTRAATRELKMRIRTALAQARAALCERTTGMDYLQEICEQGEDAIDRAIKRIDAASVCFDAAQIFTLHGFCHRMLTDFAFESKSDVDLDSPDEVNPAFYYRRAVQDFLLHKLSPSDYCSHQLRLLLKAAQGDPFRLIDQLVSVIVQESPIADYPSLKELHADFNSRLHAFACIDPSLFFEDCELLCSCYRGIKLERAQFDMLIYAINAKSVTQEQFEQLLSQEEWFLDKMHQDNLKVRKVFPADDKLHYPGLPERLRTCLLPLLHEACDVIKLQLRLAKDSAAHARLCVKEHHCFSPDQMLRQLETALDSHHFLTQVRQRYKAAIIDEFQDTDPIQWNIFKRLFIGHLETIALVGDPKQSIYAFRSADIYTYLRAATALGKESHKRLDTNYRSTPPLIEALNRLFAAPKGEGWLQLPRMRYSLPVFPVKAGSCAPSTSHLIGREAVHFFVASAERGRSMIWPPRECEEEVLFPFIASEIVQIIEKRNIGLEEIVILIKDKFQAERLGTYLNARGIPSSFRKGKDLSQAQGLSALKDFLRAVLDCGDTSKLKIALAGPFIGFDEEHIRQGRASDLMQQMKMHMQELQNILLNQGFGPFFQAFKQRVWKRKEGALYSQVHKLAEICVEEELMHRLRGEDFVYFLEQIEDAHEEDAHRFEVSPQEAKGSVVLMTVFLSKGLEFDTVFALALASRHPTKEKKIVKVGLERTLAAFDATHASCVEAMEEIDAEKMRTLYVALTRAKQQVYVPYVIDSSSKPVPVGDASPVELYFAKMSDCALDKVHIETLLRQLTCSYQFLEKQALQERSIKNEVARLPDMATPRLPEPEFLFSFSSLASKSKEVSLLEKKEDTLPLGAATGILVHRLFELIFKRSLHHPLNQAQIEALIDRESEETVYTRWKKDLVELCLDHLNLSLLHNMRLRDVPSSQLYQEFEFLFPQHETAWMKGFADLVFLYEGKYYLLDWKTNYLGPHPNDYSQEKMRQVMQDHDYFMQASIYTAALQRYVKLFDMRPFEKIFGGAIYVFVRGKGVFHFFPR